MNNGCEILSPAGDTESLYAAVRFGKHFDEPHVTNAVYLAGQRFGMRSAAKNFDENALAQGIAHAHANGVKVYITCNTLPKSNELDELAEFLRTAQSLGADAFIIADLGVMELAAKYAPKVARHVSTQMGIVNYATANALYSMGASRVVLARELSLGEITEIRAKTPADLEIEVFVHGAMCVSYSGRCLISSYMTGRDANHGDCAQPCRWKYHLYEEHRNGQYFPVEESGDGTFLYNSRDLCMIEHIPELMEAGVASLKIEGRAKSAYYTAVITNAYTRAACEYMKVGRDFALPQWIKDEVRKVSHREYETGFFFGHEPGQVTGSGGYIREYDVAAVCEGAPDSTSFAGELAESGFYSVITQRNKFCVGDELDVLPPGGRSFKTIARELQNEKGEYVQSAPHAMERLLLKTDAPVPEGAYLRVRRQTT